jgi:hypothetical protein
MSTSLTDWFPGSAKPTRKGVYERDDTGTVMCDGRPNFSKWDGSKWCSSEVTAESAARNSWESCEQDLPWRGLAENPNARVKRTARHGGRS